MWEQLHFRDSDNGVDSDDSVDGGSSDSSDRDNGDGIDGIKLRAQTSTTTHIQSVVTSPRRTRLGRILGGQFSKYVKYRGVFE